MPQPYHLTLLILFLTSIGSTWDALGPREAAGQTSRATPQSRSGPSVLRIAQSRDGLAFADTGKAFLQNASSPSLVRLPSGQIIATFDYAPDPSARTTGMAVSRSADDGRTWSRPRPIRFVGSGLPAGRCGHPTLVLMPSGLLRMYFVALGTDRDAKRESGPEDREACEILSAVSRNGLEYKPDRDVQIPLEGGWELHPTAVRIERRIDLYVDALDAPEAGPKNRYGLALRVTSQDGRHFRPAVPLRTSGLDFVGSVVAAGSRLRAYLSGDDGIRSMASNDGVVWKPEDGIRLAKGFAPAVVRLKDETYLMMYGVALDKTSGSAPQLAMESAAASGDAATVAPEWESFSPVGDESETGGSLGGNTGGQAIATPGGPDGFAPTPDLQNRVDYTSWVQQNVLAPADQNAAGSYGTLAEDLRQQPPGFLNDMFNSEKASGPPGPWSPADHPEWEASYQASQGLVAQFRAGSQDTRPYGTPPLWSQDVPPEDRLLCHWQLPSVNSYRGMARAVLSQAWRTENGVVPAGQMRDAMQTCLGNVSHLQQGATLVERLVASSERSLVEENARWALQRNVFSSPEELESTLNVLRERDVPDADPAGWMRTEHALALDAIQYLFVPDNPGQEPKLRPDRLEKLAAMTGTQGLEHFQKLTPDDAKAAIESINGFFQQAAEAWKGGYLAVKAAQPDALVRKLYEQNILTAMTLPSLSRASAVIARSEASRRATQLSYAVQLFKARNARWPASLDELPPEQAQAARTDPFTGGDFAYRVTETGPTIYTAGENGRDDGGVHSKTWGSDKSGESDDYVFWPPQK